MAKFRFPGKALKLNTRKRVRFRGSYPVSTPEELYTRKIRRGLALFGQLFGDSDEDEEEFEGFADISPSHEKGRTPSIKAVENKVEQVCSNLEKEGLVRRTRMSSVTMAVKEVREGKEKALLTLDERTKTKKENSKVQSASDVGGPECSTTLPSIVPDCRKKVTVVARNKHRQTRCRLGRQPTVKTALAKKLLAKAKKKLPSLPVVGEKSPKRFILPAMSVRSSRIIKPNKRLFADIMEMCSTSSSLEFQVNVDAAESKNSISSMSGKRLVKFKRRSRGSHSRLSTLPRLRDEEDTDNVLGSKGVGRDKMRKTISLYTEAITGTGRGQVGRPPKRLLRRLEGSQPEPEADVATSPQKCDAKESRVKEKIEKLLRSPWDDRLKQSGKVGKCDMEDLMPAPASTTSPALSASAISRNILRKARLNLNKSTLLKIRNPASLQRLIPQSDEGKVEGRCIICDRDEGENTRKFGVVICEICCSFVRSASDGPKDVYECADASGGCHFQGLVEKERCLACWLGRILQSCTMPNLLHDRLRKRLPPVLKEKIPTSLARCMNLGSNCAAGDKDAELASHTKRLPLDPGGAGGGAFGNVMDLPGGWRRKTGSEVIVISPSGEKFKSMHKLEEFLKNQGICADARVLFGNNSPVVEPANEAKSRSTALAKNSEPGRVVVTTLPGGWTRRIKWRATGGRFDTYVYSPDGRTFRSRRELSAYFQQIGKVDDIHKYFPVVNGNSDSSTPSSSDTTGSSSTEPVSSSEIGSEVSSDDKSPEASEVEMETPTSATGKVRAKAPRKEANSAILKTKKDLSVTTIDPVICSPRFEAVDQADENSSAKSSRRSLRIKTHGGKGHHKTQSVGRGLESASCSSETLNTTHFKEPSVNDVNLKELLENPKLERKQRKSKTLRTRSLSVGSRKKGDTSLTDTTESESEQRHSVESALFSRNFSRSKVDIFDKAEESKSTEKSELCSAWNLDLYESAGESLFKSDDNMESEERKLPQKSFKKRNKLQEDLGGFSATTVVPDVKGNHEKASLNLKRKVLNSNKEPSKDKNLSDKSMISPSTAKSAESSPSRLLNETQSSDASPKKRNANAGEKVTVSPSRTASIIDTKKVILSASEPKPVLGGKLASKKKPKLKSKFSRFQSFHFGNNWSRKVKWNEKGEGKVALLHSPDGQTFRSRIELQAYFKKAGKPKVDLDYYFPPILQREESPPPAVQEQDLLDDDTPVHTVITEESEHSSEASDFMDSEHGLKTSEDSCASIEGFNRSNNSAFTKLLETIPDTSRLEDFPKRILSKSGFGKKVIVVSSKAVKTSVNNSESEEAEVGVNEAGGPRVKHVCRSKAQVLGISRAVFPSPEKDRKVIKRRTREVVTVTEKAASGKILRKTVWCNKCSGCNTPNCQKCANCLDMKKYGGKGTKKKPCVKRKCLNPRLSAKSAAQTATTTEGKKKIYQVLPHTEPFETRELSGSLTVSKEVAIAKPNVVEKEPPLEIKISTQDKSSVFIPRQMTRIQPDQKDRGDIAAGKKFVPGALVNIDYWQGYDVDEMMMSGFAVTTASPLYPQTLCFRCGSAGKERLLFCMCCCEGVHPFCLEDGEGPESDTEELFWICRRCAVCHVCGAPGADSLLRCSDCRNYYHMECLGPSSHSTCQPSPDRPWKCVGCTHCSSCGSPNVTRWLDFPNKLVTLKITPPGEDPPPPLSTELALCDRCVTLRERGNFCPLCNGCYEDDDYDSKMMECGRCGEWIHAHCEGLNNEHYQILSFLPDSVEYVCRTCVLEESSNWLDAVNKELIAGCEAVIQALLSSRCAKHLVKREAIKLSSSGVTSSLPCLPAFNTSAVQKKIEMPPSNAKIDSVTESSMTLLEDSYNTLSSIGESDVKVLQSERNYGSEQAAGNEDLLIFEKSFDGSNDLSATLPLRQDHSKSSETSHFSSAQMPVISENVLNLPGSSLDNFCAEGTGLPQGDVCDAGMSIPQLGGQTAEERRGVNERFCVKDLVEEDLGGDSNVCCGKDRVDLGDKETSSRPPRENTKLRLKRRRTRSSSAWTSLGPPDNSASTGIQSDSIKLRKCSVRLKDICKSRSPSLSPKFSHESDTEDKDRRDPQTLEGPPPAEDYLAVAADVLSSFPKTNSENAAVQKETEKSLKETLPGILTLKERDVSCTQVDGPNDETPTAGHVIRNLFYEDRNLALLDSTSVTDKKCDVLTYERKSCENVITNTNIKQVENQLINPKDKITKDIDDDCVSSEASSFCDTDTEIESIQEDPEEPKDLLGVKEKLKDRKYNTVLQFHVDTARVIENGRHLNRSQTRNVLATYAKHMKECFPWFDLKTMNIFELVDKRRPFPLPHLDHNYAFQTPLTGSSHLRFALRDASSVRKRSISPLKGQVVSDRRKCVLCGRESDDEPNGAGRLLYLGQDEWMHINCGLWSSEVYEEVDGGLQNVYLAVNRGRLVKCSTCQERGATVGCCHKTCQATYHFLCARRSCCQFMEDKRIFCPVHMSTANGEEKSDDFPVNRCVYVDMDSEKKKWKQVAGNRVNIVIGSLIIRNLGRIIPESDSAEALIPVEFSCSRKYWSTSDPTKKVTYTCRTKRVVPVLDESHPAGEVEIHRTIDHSMGEEAVQKEMAAVRKWFKQLEESKVEKKSRETNIIPPHLCPLYRSIKEKEIVQVAEQVMRCCTPPAMVELDVRHCIEDIIDRVSRSVEEESLLFDTDLPAIVSADDNELISMVLNDLDACDPITLHSTPSTSGRPSPLDIDFLSTCDHMMDSGKVSHSGNLTQEAQETVCNSRAMMDDVNDANTLSPDLHSALSQSGLDPQTDNLHDHIHQDTYDEQPPPDAYDIKEPIVETVAPPPAQHLGLVPLTSTLNSAEDGSASSSILESANCLNSSNSSSEGKSNSCISTNGISGSYSSSSGSSSGSSNCSSSSSSGSSSSSSSSTGNSSNSSTSGSSTGGDNSSPERCITGVISNTSSPETCCRATSENLGNTDSSNSGSDSSQSMRSNTETSSAVVSVKANSSLKQICRVLPMPSTHGRRSSSASEHSDAVGQDQSPPASRRSPCHSLEQDRTNSNGRKNDRKKICMKRNYKTVIKKYPLRSGMRKSKPYETVQIEINETIEIPRGEGSGMMRKSLKRKWSGILDTDEEDEKSLKEVGEQEGPEMTSDHGSDEDNTKENSVSKKVLKFSDDNSDITVSIVNNNNNLCDFSKSRVHKYRHKTVLQLDGAADGSSSSAEMSESQDEGIIEEVKRPGEHDDMHSPPLHSTLAMRIKEQSLARSSPGEEGPYKCGKCKRLYRTKESYQKHIETCTFEVDSSSTSDDEDEEDYDHIKTEEEEMKVVSPQPLSEKAPEMLDISKTIDSSIEDGAVESATFSQGSASSSVASQDFTTSQNISLIENIVSNLEAKSIAGNSNDMIQDYSDILGRPKPSGDEPVTKKIRIDSNLPRQPGVHRQVRTAIKKHASVSGEDIELLQVVQGVPSPGTEVFVPPPVSPVKFSPIVKKNSSPRRYSNIRLMRGGRNYQYRRAPPHMPSQDHFQGAASNIQMASATAVTAAPIQVTMQTMGNASAQILTPAAPTAAAFQPFSGQTSPYSATPQLASPVTHLSPAVQMASPVAPQVAQQVSPQVNPQAQLLTMVSAPSVAVPQGYTLQYVGSFRDGEMGAGGGSLVTYPTAPVVVPQPQLVVTPQQSSVVMPQMVNTNITYSFATPEALVINQPTMVPGMQPVQYLPQQQQQLPQQTQVIQSHSEQQVGSVMQYNQSGMSSQTASPVPTLSSHHLHSGQMHSSSCIPFSDVHSNQLCVAQHQQPQTLQPPNIVSRELSFTSHGSKPMFTNQAVNSSMNTCLAPSVSLPVSSSMGIHATTMARHRPQASVAPLPIVTTSAASDVGFQEGISHSRLPFSDRPHSAVIRTVATVAPAVITTTTVVSISTCSSSTKLTSADCSLKVATVRPRPTYSYRDAMREKQMERQKQRQELLQLDAAVHENNQADFIKGKERLENIASDSESDSENDNASRSVDKDKEDRVETQSYKLVLRKDSSTRTGFNVLPISGPDAPLPAPEVKELRIKAKVSVGPKRKKAKSRDAENDLIFANRDITQDLYVNEQLPNFSVNPMHAPAQDDPSIFEKPKSCSTEPYIVFELTSEDGFHVESRHISEVWQKVFDAVSAARASMKMDSKCASNIQDCGQGGAMSGLHMLGLTHNAVQYLLEQLPGAKDCHKYSFQFHRRPQEEGAVEENPTGCARTESFKTRSPYDIFSWLASKHRRMPERALVQQEEIQLSTTRRATSLELPMAMRYRHLRETAREAVGVFRSSIHGRGLFCKRDIDSGEMVIEYAGQVIRSSMCDMREKDYESKGIGCYMFRIDDDTVIDATMHGNAARFINHSCDPNCYSRVVDILGKKHIIIFALRRIMRGEELTYDYKFPIEDDKIPCTCGARRCRKYLN